MIMTWQILTPVTVNAVAALATHTWLRRWDPVTATNALFSFALIPLLSTLVSTATNGLIHIPSPFLLLKGYMIYCLTLLGSVAAYRLSPFHPLAKYPGPTILKLTKLWTVWVAYRGHNHLFLQSLHQKYGPIVRIGPNELSTTEKQLIPEILGIQGLPKGPMWDGRRYAKDSEEAKKPYRSLIDCRSNSIHAVLRKPWSKSFTAEPLQNYEQLLVRRTVQLNNHLARQVKDGSNGQASVDMAKWMAYFSFDFMGDIAFGTSFEIMRDGDVKHEHQTVTEGQNLPAVIMHIPWIRDIVRAIPSISSKRQEFIAMGLKNGVERSKKELKHKDLFYYMAESAGGTMADNLKVILPDAMLAIVAGSDTTSSALANAVHLLITHPDARRKLVTELDEAFQKHDIPDVSAINPDQEVERFNDVLAGLKYLNGVINETLRLFPPVPTAIQRAPEAGSGGNMLQGGGANVFLPEGNAILIPPWVLHRDPRNFSPEPESFIPERWFGDSAKYKTSRDVFIPFSVGPRNCVGRPIAMMELRYAISTIFRNFNVDVDGQKHDAKDWDAQILDRFTLALGELNVKISFRRK